ncbi:CvpA family protein [Clostridium sp. D2Q-14]|uniref:CvpA family protein n=1 Tax=Anaeromonas gelatinilytica TaxID=2683194 RepID=UPI00193B01D5|nr:CvpA family protein [Anaeromonas gelatinilytica]MBS4534402.1 CvpA family protein [Anaeromonas gelatinilytica]
MNFADIIIIIIILLTGLNGFHRGFILSAFSLLGTILALVIANKFYPIIASLFINHTNFYDSLYDKIYPNIVNITEGEGVFSFDTLVKIIRIPQILINNSIGKVDYNSVEVITRSITTMIINIISIIILFIIANIILSILVRMLNIFFKLPILNSFNKIGGLIFGLIRGVLVIFIIYAILTPVISLNPDGFIAVQTTNSVLGDYFYNNNLIIGYLETIVWN